MTITHMVCLPICLQCHGMTLSHCPPLVGSLGAMHTFTLSHTPWRPQLVVAIAPSHRPAAGAAASPPPRLAAADRPTRSCQCSKNQIMQNFDGPGTIAPNPGHPCHPLSLCVSASVCLPPHVAPPHPSRPITRQHGKEMHQAAGDADQWQTRPKRHSQGYNHVQGTGVAHFVLVCHLANTTLIQPGMVRNQLCKTWQSSGESTT